MDLKKMSVIELKAAWLDLLVEIETSQGALQLIRQEIASRKIDEDKNVSTPD